MSELSTYVKLPAAPSKKRRALSAEEGSWILECTCYARLPAITAIYAGLRRGEMTAFKWSDVDLKNRIITVRESYNFKTGQLKKPKTEAGLRKIPIVDVLFQTLSAIPKGKQKGYVFQINGKMLTEGW